MAVIEPHVNYAIFVHEGTRPHIIRPRVKQALYWKGARHPVMSVRHPGTKKNPFMEEGLKNSERQVVDIFEKNFSDYLGSFK